ncbi:MAG: hypothetical protein WCF23_04835 [Candidatus Nitrosopolaris sp.]
MQRMMRWGSANSLMDRFDYQAIYDVPFEVSDFFNSRWDFLISNTNTSAPETARITPAVCNIWMYTIGCGGWDLGDIRATILANNTNEPITTMATALFTISTFRATFICPLIQN